ncbi:hypothetical protein [Streptomyces sp. SID3343]|uniref:hypothetical protein n=1 Tax=Streptomyces sp. SID3343 TaxID=2690260 RepID=UPI00136A5C31|nr:hypothetical protein [Streptomyces sp. SID3343]MYW00277.1 hypothetical protein [Streptomyces sp. SID3343]
MGAKSRYMSILVLDVERFGRRSDVTQEWVRGRLYELLHSALEAAGIAWDSCVVEDRGDGAILLVPPSVPKEDLTDLFIDRLHAGLRNHDRHASDEARIRLRVSLHAGDVVQDARGWSGTAINTACRLVNADALRDVLTAADRACLALIVSGAWHEAVVAPERGGLERSTYGEVRVQAKEVDETAWVYVPGYQRPPATDGGAAKTQPKRRKSTARRGGTGSGFTFNGDFVNNGDLVGGNKLVQPADGG